MIDIVFPLLLVAAPGVALWLIYRTARAVAEALHLLRTAWRGNGRVVAIVVVGRMNRNDPVFAPVVQVDTGAEEPWSFTAGGTPYRGLLPAEGATVRVLCDPRRRHGRLHTVGEVWGKVAASALFAFIALAFAGIVIWVAW